MIYQRFYNKNPGNKAIILVVFPRFKGFKVTAVNGVIKSKDY